NPERITRIANPYIVIDFCSERRHEIIKYITETYGKCHVGCFADFGFRDTKSVMMEIATLLDVPDNHKNLISKYFPSDFYLPMKIAMDNEPRLIDLKQKSDKLQKLFDITMCLDRLFSYRGIHERGIVVGRKKLKDLIPLYRDEENESISIQYEGYYGLEEYGFVLFELFGIKSLTFIRKIEDLIRKENPYFSIKNVPIDDEATLNIFRKGDTKDIFEFQSPEMKEFLRQINPDSIEDLIVLNAMHYSYSWKYIPRIIDRKNGSIEITYPDPSLEEILKPTYGIFVYPEQFMEAASKVSGFSLGKSRGLWRKFIKKKAKKIEEEIKRDKIEFINGAVGRGYSKNQASNIFEDLKSVDGYASSKSHAVAYTMIAYRMAFLKAHYPEEFRIGIIDF
ncbi:MAG: DNA polymerase III subunit alpha, partial [Spirochaetales bacterium]|nr:DNA polymerase III subunit alpha [Spirochaetales bacterium]